MSGIEKYISQVDSLYRSGNATEHSYRPALQEYLKEVLKGVEVTNEPRRQECGAPDYILSRKGIPVGFIEAKEVGKNLNRVEEGGRDDDQWKRYTQSLDNIILTDYLEFRFFTDGVKNAAIRIGEVENGKVVLLSANIPHFETLCRDFAAFQGQTIKSAKKLAEMMAHKAALMRDVFFNVVKSDEPSSLKDQLVAFKEVLMHNMDETQFADVYAQTVAYGLFTARLHDKTLHDFSRGEALTLIPRTNPFLQKLFQYVAGADIDDRVVWIVDALCEVYRAADLKLILKDFGSTTGRKDPILHFYETFLAEYDPKLREVRGVYYTPEPVVQFIVRAVDDVLKEHFGLKGGLADTEKIDIEVAGHKKGKTVKVKEQVHKVQILDIATGTGTFLAEVVKQIYAKFEGQEGLWGNYVERDLLPRMHGFELLVASYAMCHMKLDMLLRETGYDSSKSSQRLSVYLTNSLEEHHKDSHLPFANWLSSEANEASRIKRDMPIMIALGNPPYSGHSANKGEWIQNLLDVYKKEPGGKGQLQERNSKWLNDDYVKFIRLGEHYIEKNGEGVLAYITNHGYLDNPTFRGMRWHLMNTFDEVYVLDLHGNAKKKEVTPDGKADKNVFDIMQGVSIIIAVKVRKEGKKKALATVHHADLWGERAHKYEMLEKGTLKSLQFKKIVPLPPEYFLFPQDNEFLAEHNQMFAVDELFHDSSVGIVTARDALTIHGTKDSLLKTIGRFSLLPVEQAREEYKLGKDVRDWRVEWAQEDLKNTKLGEQYLQKICYRPFDIRWTYYTGKTKGFHCMPRGESMRRFLGGDNLALVTVRRKPADREASYFFVTKNLMVNGFIRSDSVSIDTMFPLYSYEKIGELEEKRLNLDKKIYSAIRKNIPEVTPESLFDYIYAVLHSSQYRKRFGPFLTLGFPRIPYPQDSSTFAVLAKLGGEIRALHLMESKTLDHLATSYPVGGKHEVVRLRWEDTDKKSGLGKVWINPTQYFDRVPKNAWEFFIGGYQPAQKWLKDRKDCALTPDDVRHWQKIIVALSETDRLMREIDKVEFLPKG